MEYQSFGRPQRPKGANIKQALKVILVLAVCTWLVYQIKHSTNKTHNYGGQTRLVAGYGAVSLGRKGTPSRLDERALPVSKNVDSAVDDVFDGAREDKVEEEFGHVNEKFGTNKGKEMEHEPESQPTKRRESKLKEHGTVNDSQSDDKELQLRELPNSVQIRKNDKSNFSGKENDEDKGHRTWEKEIDEVLSFHDENGVPPDGDENISNFSKGIRLGLGKSNIYEATPGEENDVEVNVEGSKNDATADEEFTSGNVTHADTSGINNNAEVGEVDGQVL